MQLGMIGLGRMGANMVRRLVRAGHRCTVFDMFPKAVEDLTKEGATGSSSLADFVKKLESGDYPAIRTFARADLGSLEWDTSIVEEAHQPAAS